MEVKNEFLSEQLAKVLQNCNKDVLEVLFEMYDDIKYIRQDNMNIRQDNKYIRQKVDKIDQNVDYLVETLTKLVADFSDLKSENRDIEQKLTLMNSKLTKLEKHFGGDELDDYIALSQSLYSYWDEYDELTRKFIPMSEFLYSKLQKCTEPDYSPMILELCRAIENEFLLKVFIKYTLDLLERHHNDLDDFLSIDRTTEILKKKTGQFVKTVSKAQNTHKPEYTLGTMNTILGMMNNSSILSSSPLMADFKSYLESHTECSKLLAADYVKKIDDIVRKYRNPSAHPEFMKLEDATDCKRCMPDRIDYLMECMAH